MYIWITDKRLPNWVNSAKFTCREHLGFLHPSVSGHLSPSLIKLSKDIKLISSSSVFLRTRRWTPGRTWPFCRWASRMLRQHRSCPSSTFPPALNSKPITAVWFRSDLHHVMSSRHRGGAVVAVTSPRSKAFPVRLILKWSSSPLCRSQLMYCNSLCSALTHEAVSCLQLLQNPAARLLKNQSISLQVSLGYTPVKRRIDFKILLMTFKAFHGLTRSYWICSHLVSPPPPVSQGHFG